MKGKYESKLSSLVEGYQAADLYRGPRSNSPYYAELPLSEINEDPQNEGCFNMDGIPELANNIKRNGFHGAIVVWRQEDGSYVIKSGHRRARAAAIAGLNKIPAIIEAKDTGETELATKKKRFDVMVDMNLDNRNITPLDWAHIVSSYMEFLKEEDAEARASGDHSPKGKRKDRCAERFNISSSQVSRLQNLLLLIPELQGLLSSPDFPTFSLDKAASLDEGTQRKIYELLKDIEHPDKRTVENVISRVVNGKSASTVTTVKASDPFHMNVERIRKGIDRETDREKLVSYRDELKSLLSSLEEKLNS